jgi:Rieske Fe-S protein
MLQFDASGNRALRYFDEMFFPVDLMIVYSEESQTAIVFLRRSPHGGCLLLWNQADSRLNDPCFGSNFDLAGNYMSGPSPRDLDQLPASVRDGMIWVTPEIIYGETHP